MPGFVREHLRPLVGSAGLHVLLLALLAGAALRWSTSQPPVQLAIEGVIVDARSLPKSALAGRPEPVSKPEPIKEAPQPALPPVPAPAAAQAKAAKAEAQAETERQRTAGQQAREKAAADTRRKAAADAELKKSNEAEARRKQQEQEESAGDAKAKAEHEADLRRQLAAEEEGATVARSGVVDEYRTLLVQTIQRNWIRPPSARAGLECTLYVTQAPGGTVVDVKLGACNGDQAVRESIANAVYRASPLPAPRDPRAFERRLEIVFKPTE
jgi:colicin import membrane protein